MRAPNDLYLSRRDIIKPADVVVVVVAYTSTYIYIYKSVRIIHTITIAIHSCIWAILFVLESEWESDYNECHQYVYFPAIV